MHGWAVGVGACAGVFLTACGLAMGGLGEAPDGGAGIEAGPIDGSGATGDVIVQGGDASAGAEAGADATKPGSDAGPGADATAPTDGGSDGTTVPEASSDAPTSDEPPPPDAGCNVVCNGACSPDPDCRACAGAPLLCGATRTCASDCSACPSSPIECFACDSNRKNPIGTCQPDQGNTAYCLDTNYAGQYQGGTGEHCGCTTAADCPGDTQVCIRVGSVPNPPLGCFTCGETATQTFDCKGGGKCNAPQRQCH